MFNVTDLLEEKCIVFNAMQRSFNGLDVGSENLQLSINNSVWKYLFIALDYDCVQEILFSNTS